MTPNAAKEEELVMRLKCKPGDLAIVVHDEEVCSANIGRLVRVEGPPEVHAHYGRVCWLIYPVDPRPWWVMRSSGPVQLVITARHFIDHPDAWLMPVGPEGQALKRRRRAVKSSHAAEDLVVAV
ncbi:hypothetical protein [Comamonas serinivorans]|nr:hypothetical protein [Comamonas serinivorans]